MGLAAQEIKAGTDHLAEARSAIGPARGRWGRRLATVLAMYHAGQQLHGLWKSHQGNRAYTVIVVEGDEIYDLVQEWLLGKMPDAAQRSLMARTVQRRGGQVVDPHAMLLIDRAEPGSPAREEDQPVTRQVVLRYDGSRSQLVDLDGQPVDVRIEVTDTGEQRGSEIYRPRKIIFSAKSLDGRRAVVAFLQGIAETLIEGRRVPRLIIASRWGHWQAGRTLDTVSLDHVVLPAGHIDGIAADLRLFLDSEARYAELGVPWHRGYLFHGPPGTGKTKTARALASTLGLDVYWLPLSDLEGDTQLNELVGQVPERSVLLLEDIDIAHAATDRDDDRKGITLAGLLNSLDGVVTPHGLVVMMTTNCRDQLDDALVRAGRVSLEVEMTHLVPEQAARLIAHLTGLPCELYEDFAPDLGAGVPFPKVTAADLVGVVTERMHDPEAAFKECIAFLDHMADAEDRERCPG